MSQTLADLPDVLRSEHISAVFGISKAQARLWLRSGRIPATRIGRRLYTTKKALLAILEGGTV